MSSLNKVMLIGRLGGDPEAQYFDNGTKASFTLATNRRYKNRDGQTIEETDWHRVVIWGKLAGIAIEYLKKGSLVYVEGRLQTRSWEDQSGNKRYVTEVNALNFTMLGGRDNSGGGNNNAKRNTTTTNNNAAASNTNNVVAASNSNATTSTAPEADEMDDLPF
ncbi:MAG: single-stranded DNA-binding protein [Chitinophagales bacterium]